MVSNGILGAEHTNKTETNSLPMFEELVEAAFDDEVEGTLANRDKGVETGEKYFFENPPTNGGIR